MGVDFFIFILVFLKVGVLSEEIKEEVLKVTARDSYLDAYKDSHLEAVKLGKSNPIEKLPQKSLPSSAEKIDRDFTVDSPEPYHVYSAPQNSIDREIDNYGAPRPQYGQPNPQYGPPGPQYGPPDPQYGPPSSQYGPPNPQYGPQNPQYGPPVPQYGPPLEPQYFRPPGPVYGGPQSLQVFYGQQQGMPHALLSFWDKLKFKLDLFTIGKILLKLVIFKKIISLIAIICLLLFIPALKKKVGGSLGSQDEGYMRSAGPQGPSMDHLNTITAFVQEAIDKYSDTDSVIAKNLDSGCKTIYCRTQKVLKKLDKKMSYDKLTKLYSRELA